MPATVKTTSPDNHISIIREISKYPVVKLIIFILSNSNKTIYELKIDMLHHLFKESNSFESDHGKIFQNYIIWIYNKGITTYLSICGYIIHFL